MLARIILHTALAGALLAPGLATAATPTSPATATPRRVVPDTIAERVKACVLCHGQKDVVTANGYFPRIDGKPAGYLYNQLRAFRDGRRVNRDMRHLLTAMSDDYLREIARHFAALPLPAAERGGTAPAIDSAQVRRGRALVQIGDVQAAIPACVACHGDHLGGAAPVIPGLVGLSRDYVSAQIGAWRVGNRRSLKPDCMAAIAAKLSADDVAAVNAWLSTLPTALPTALPSSGPARTGKAPLDCGVVIEAARGAS